MSLLTKLHRLIPVGCLILLVIAGFFLVKTAVSTDIGSMAIYRGTTEIIRNTTQISGTNGQGVQVSDTIQVNPESRSALILKDASLIRLGANSRVEVATLAYRGGTIKDARFRLLAGRLWSNTKPIMPDGEYRVETPTMVASVRGTRFDIRYQNGVTELWVISHAVAVSLISAPLRTTMVKAGEHIMIHDSSATEDFSHGPNTEDPPQDDDWVAFNQQEDLKSPTGDVRETTPVATTTMITTTGTITISTTNGTTTLSPVVTPDVTSEATTTTFSTTTLPKTTPRPTSFQTAPQPTETTTNQNSPPMITTTPVTQTSSETVGTTAFQVYTPQVATPSFFHTITVSPIIIR